MVRRPVAEGDLDWPVDDVRVDGVTEIRVHGVGGTPAGQMLGDPHVRQVTGDRTAGIWRGTDRELAGRSRWHREAYSWGGLTSRALASALWLTLVPFALVNLAGWMALGRPRQPGKRVDWRVPYQQSLVRVVALAATWTYVLFAAQIAMDLGGWQCTQVTSCRLRTWPETVVPVAGQLAGHPARAVVLAALGPLAMVLGLYALTVVSRRRYEAYDGDRRLPDLWLPGATLFTASFWRGAAYARRSRWLHLSSSIVVVAMLIVAVADAGGAQATDVRRLAIAGGAFLGAAALLAAWERARRTLLHGPLAVWVMNLLALVLLGLAGYLAWRQPAMDLAGANPGIMPGIREAFNALVATVFGVGLIHALVVISGRVGARARGRRLPWLPGPFTAMSVGVWVTFAVWAGITIWVARWLSTNAVPQAEETVDNLVYPQAYMVLAELTIAAMVAMAVGTVLAIGTSYAWSWLMSRWRGFPTLAPELGHWMGQTLAGGLRAAAPVRRRFRWFGRATKPSKWLGGVRDRKWSSNMGWWLERALSLAAILAVAGAVWYSVDYGHRWLGRDHLLWTLGAVAALGVGLSVLAWLAATSRPVDGGRRRFSGWLALAGGVVVFAGAVVAARYLLQPALDAFPDRPAPQKLPSWVPTNPGVTSTVLTAIPLGAVLLVRQAIRSPQTRRIVGISWDVATFWPRSFHPLAPPSYAERAVPELAIRIRHLLARGGVLIGGHSQGAVLATAAVAQLTDLSDEERGRLSVITYGNPTGHLYMRWFPHYVNPDLIEGARCTAADTDGLSWVNFYRYTDPIGRALFAPDSNGPADPPTEVTEQHGDVWLPDPPTDWYRRGDGTPRVRAHAHSGYERQHAFAEHVQREVTRLDEMTT